MAEPTCSLPPGAPPEDLETIHKCRVLGRGLGQLSSLLGFAADSLSNLDLSVQDDLEQVYVAVGEAMSFISEMTGQPLTPSSVRELGS